MPPFFTQEKNIRLPLRCHSHIFSHPTGTRNGHSTLTFLTCDCMSSVNGKTSTTGRRVTCWWINMTRPLSDLQSWTTPCLNPIRLFFLNAVLFSSACSLASLSHTHLFYLFFKLNRKKKNTTYHTSQTKQTAAWCCSRSASANKWDWIDFASFPHPSASIICDNLSREQLI